MVEGGFNAVKDACVAQGGDRREVYPRYQPARGPSGGEARLGNCRGQFQG